MNFVDVETVVDDVTSTKSAPPPTPSPVPSTSKLAYARARTLQQPPTVTTTQPIICLGLDKKSGRVKWCPDCQLIKYLLILPLILLPVTVIFVLMVRISNIYNGRIEILPATERIKVSSELEPYHRPTRDVNELMATINHNCEIYRHLSAESIDMHEKELLHEKELFRDIRTSFIPSEFCLQHNRNRAAGRESVDQSINSVDDRTVQVNQSKSVVQLRHWINKYAGPIDLNRLSNEHDLLSYWRRYLHRRRRRRQLNSHNISIALSTATAVENFDYKNVSIDDDKPLEIPAFLRTFWKGGKTYDQIRNSQVEIIKQYMDQSVEPCEDFYQYACGNWERLNPIPKDKAAYDTFEMLREILDIELNQLLLAENTAADNKIESSVVREHNESNSTESVPPAVVTVSDSPNSIEINVIKPAEAAHRSNKIGLEVNAEQKAKFLYKSCMNADILEQRQLEPLYRLLESLGGWPVLDGDKWDASKFDWLELAAKLRLYNNDVLINQWVGPDIKNSDENVIQFDQNSLGLPTRDYFIKSSNDVYLAAYQEFARQVIFLCGTNENDSIAAADEIVKFEIELAKIMAPPQERMNVTQLYRRMTLHALYDYVPEINWQKYLETVLEREIDRSEVVVMFALNFMQDLVQLVQQTDRRTVANYMLWKFVRYRINSLDDRFQGAKQVIAHKLKSW